MLSINNIEVVYDSVILVLKGVSLEVTPGAITTLLGGNGAGKTTTLKAISGVLRTERGEVTNGSITFEGRRIDGTPAYAITKLGISQVFEGTRINIDKCSVVFNHVHALGEITEASVRKIKMKMPVIGFIPNHPAGFVKALNEGKPYVSMFPRTPSSKVIKSISDKIFSVTSDEEKAAIVAA